MSTKKRSTREKSAGSSAATSPSSSISSSMNVSGSYNINNNNNNNSSNSNNSSASGRGNQSKTMHRNSPLGKSDAACNMFVQLSYAAPQHILNSTANTTNTRSKSTEEVSSEGNICITNTNEYYRWCGRGWNKDTDDMKWKATEEWLNIPLSKSMTRKVMADVYDHSESAQDKTSTTTDDEEELAASDYKVNTNNNVLTRRSLRESWWQYVAQQIGSSALYPYHVICWRAQNKSAQHKAHGKAYECALFTARLITNIIHTYTNWCTYVDYYKCNVYGNHSSDTNLKSKECKSNMHHDKTEYDNHDYVYLLNHSLQCTGYAQPEAELPDVTLSTTSITETHTSNITEENEVKPMQESLESNKIRLQLLCNMHSAHINVCCGLFYYKLIVYDVVQRRMKSVKEIADALMWIVHDARRRLSDLALPKISDEDKSELVAFYTLLSQLSYIKDSVKVDVMRRLRNVSKVNAYALYMLDSALFTVVVDVNENEVCGTKHLVPKTDTTNTHVDSNTKECAYQSEWLHNALSLYVRSPRSEPTSSKSETVTTTVNDSNNNLHECSTEVELRTHATLISMNTLQRFAHRVMELSHWNDANEELIENNKEMSKYYTEKTPMTLAESEHINVDGYGSNNKEYQDISNNINDSNKSNCDIVNHVLLDNAHHDDVEYLEMWLPERQRFPLRPYLQTLQPCSSSSKYNHNNQKLLADNVVSACMLQQPLHRQREESSHIAQLRAMKCSDNTSSPSKTTTIMSGITSFAQVCLNTIHTVHQMHMHQKKHNAISENEMRVPRVCFASQNVNATVPSLTHLWGREIENYLRVCKSPSVLIDQHVRNQVQSAALERIGKLIDECVYSPCPLHFASFISSNSCTEKSEEQANGTHDNKNTADVCITASLLSLPFLNSLSHSDAMEKHANTSCNVNYTLSKLRLNAKVHVYCSLRQVRAQKRICYSDAIVDHLEMQSITNSDADAFTQTFHSL